MERFLQHNLMQLIIGGIIVVNIIIWSLVILRAVTRRRRHLRSWQGFADRNGLRLDPGGLFANPRIHGQYDGRAVDMSISHRTRNGVSSTYTKLTVSVKNPNFRSLKISRHGKIMGFLDRAIAGEDIQVGNTEFDSRMTVRGDPPEMVRYVLGDGGMSTPLMEMRREGEITLRQSDNQLAYQHDSLELDIEYLTGLLNTMGRLAGRVESWQAPPGWGVETIDTRKG